MRTTPLILLSLLATGLQAQQAPDSLILDVLGQVSVRRDFRGLPRDTVSVSFHGGSAQRYSGVRLRALLEGAGLPAGGVHGPALAQYVSVEAGDGYRVVFGAGDLDTTIVTRVLLLADSVDGRPLAGPEGRWRLIVGGDLRGARSVRGVTVVRVREVPGP